MISLRGQEVLPWPARLPARIRASHQPHRSRPLLHGVSRDTSGCTCTRFLALATGTALSTCSQGRHVLHAEFAGKALRIALEPVGQAWGIPDMYGKDADGNCVRIMAATPTAPPMLLWSRSPPRAPPQRGRSVLEVETDLHGYGSRRHVVCAAEGGEEVVQRILVRQVDDR